MIAVADSKKKYTSSFAHYYERYLDDAAFLWVLRSLAVEFPHYSSDDILDLEKRIELNIDGLLSAPDESWLLAEAAVQLLDPGEIFVASVLAFRSLDIVKIQRVVEVGLSDARGAEGLVSAMAWLPGRLVHSWIKKFLTSKDLNHKYLALAVCSARREDPREFLAIIIQREDCIKHHLLYAQAIRVIGELKRFDLVQSLVVGISNDNPTVAFWARWSSILMGDKSQVSALQTTVLEEGGLQREAIEISFRILPLEQARQWISLLAKQPNSNRLVIKATAILGDPLAVNWIIAQMSIPALSRIAGEAFSTITGIDLTEHKLALEDLPNLDELLLVDEEDENAVNLSDDEYLPFPDVDKIAAIWQKYQQRFTSGQRYFLGRQLDENHLVTVFNTGKQRHRKAAALELSILKPAHYLLNHAARNIQE